MRSFAMTRAWVEGTEFSYAMWTPDDEIAGAASLMTRMGPGVLEIGYWVHTAHTGRGLATGAALTLTQAALSMDHVNRVAIRHDAGNLASARVAERAEFVEVQRRPSTLDQTRDGTGVEVVWERTRS
jgi:RimJ/RimL family protein N-acetyltransferase